MEPLDYEYKELISSINHLAFSLTKHENIRMKLWLQKLSNPMTNQIWKQNRNLYLKALRQMLQQGGLQSPFHQTPPEGPLQKITLYDIPYPIRIKLIDDDKKAQRKSSSCQKNRSLSRKNSIGSKIGEPRSLSKNSKNIMQHKRKIAFDSVITKQEQIQNIPYLNNFKTQTMRTQDLHFGSIELQSNKCRQTQKIHFKSNNCTYERCLLLLSKTVKFLTLHHQDLEDQIAFGEVIEKILQCGDEFGHNLRQTKARGDDSVRFEKTNQRIKQNLLRGDLNSMEFLSYLGSLN